MSDSCSCVAIYVEEGCDEYGGQMRVAGTERKCIECTRTIGLGEKYEHSWTAELDDDDEPIDVSTYDTCCDCVSMRNAFFCDGWYYGRTWDDLGEHLTEVVQYGDGVSSECMMALTKSARDDVCDIIEDIWSGGRV